MCKECYVDQNRITPLLKPRQCLTSHIQYICGTCGRSICIEKDPNRGLQRWNFPFKSLEIAKLYLRTADYTRKQACGIYAIKSSTGRVSYKIFPSPKDLQVYLQKNKNKTCESRKPLFQVEKYQEYPNTQVRKLEPKEIEAYLLAQSNSV